jgi:hypothetical protein
MPALDVRYPDNVIREPRVQRGRTASRSTGPTCSTIADEGHGRAAEHAPTAPACYSRSSTLLRLEERNIDARQEPATSVCITSEGQLLIIRTVTKINRQRDIAQRSQDPANAIPGPSRALTRVSAGRSAQGRPCRCGQRRDDRAHPGRNDPALARSILEEVLLVHFLGLVGLLGPDTHAMVEQQRGKARTIGCPGSELNQRHADFSPCVAPDRCVILMC